MVYKTNTLATLHIIKSSLKLTTYNGCKACWESSSEKTAGTLHYESAVFFHVVYFVMLVKVAAQSETERLQSENSMEILASVSLNEDGLLRSSKPKQ